MTDLYTLITAIFSALATALAAFATWHAPKAAAKLADELRRAGATIYLTTEFPWNRRQPDRPALIDSMEFLRLRHFDP
jgi:hypothetical protein